MSDKNLNGQSCCIGRMQHSVDGKSCSGSGRELTWVDLVSFYPAPEECLATFLVASAAEVLAGAKPANLIRILDRELPCGRSIHRLWQAYGKQVLGGSVLSALTLREDREGALLLLYRPELLEKRLQGLTMRAFLKQRGYPQPLDLNSSLEHLAEAFKHNDSPDEVGIFLGYPVKDVRAFSAGQGKAWNGRCLWRIYGPPARSLKLYDHYCQQRRQLTARLVEGGSPSSILKAA